MNEWETVQQIIGTHAYYSDYQPNVHTLTCTHTCKPKTWNTHTMGTGPALHPSTHTHPYIHTSWEHTTTNSLLSSSLPTQVFFLLYTGDIAYLGTSIAELPSMGSLYVCVGGGSCLTQPPGTLLFKSCILHGLSLSNPVQSSSSY